LIVSRLSFIAIPPKKSNARMMPPRGSKGAHRWTTDSFHYRLIVLSYTVKALKPMMK
jgi:hypothetical protein